MLTEPLPHTLDIRKAAARGVTVSGALNPPQLQRFRALLADDEGRVEVSLAFSRDEENRSLVEVAIEASVNVTCQRCLERMPKSLRTGNTLAAVYTDEQARHLPRHLDPLIVPEESCDLWELAEDELILGLPAFSYHDTDECKEILADFSGPAPEQGESQERPNPFNVLEQLKPGSKS